LTPKPRFALLIKKILLKKLKPICTQAILLTNGVDSSEFSEEILADLPRIAPGEVWAIPADEVL
jgi:hypothetical protein